jgi:lipoprotein-anchoring transpeptidase ErfK/SrfK
MLASIPTFDLLPGQQNRRLDPHNLLPGGRRMRHVLAACILASVGFAAASAQAQPLNYAPEPSFPASIFQPLMPREQPQAVPEQQVGEEATPAPAEDRLRRRIVDYRGGEAPGTIIIDTPNTQLYYVLGEGKAVRYGIGVGREGFTWSGVRTVGRKAEWPDWIPPESMLDRQPYLPRWMAGGPDNPLGARAMYLAGTIYRIHGTNTPSSLGKRMSSGCIRMLNEDVIDLYRRVNIGAKVVVLPDRRRTNTVAKRSRPHATVTAARAVTRVY